MIHACLTKVLSWKPKSQFSVMPWDWKVWIRGFVKGKSKGEDYERLSVFVVVSQQTFYDWRKAEEQFKEGVMGIGN